MNNYKFNIGDEVKVDNFGIGIIKKRKRDIMDYYYIQFINSCDKNRLWWVNEVRLKLLNKGNGNIKKDEVRKG